MFCVMLTGTCQTIHPMIDSVSSPCSSVIPRKRKMTELHPIREPLTFMGPVSTVKLDEHCYKQDTVLLRPESQIQKTCVELFLLLLYVPVFRILVFAYYSLIHDRVRMSISRPSYNKEKKGIATSPKLSIVDATNVLTHIDYMGIVAERMLAKVDSLKQTGHDIDLIMRDKSGQIPSIILSLKVGCEELIGVYRERLAILNEMY